MIALLNLFDIIPGKEGAYAEYLRRVQPILDRHGAKVLLYGLTRMIYMGSATQEYCGIVSHRSTSALQAFSKDTDFLAIRAMRDESTENYILTVIEDFGSLDTAVDHLEQRLTDTTSTGDTQ